MSLRARLWHFGIDAKSQHPRIVAAIATALYLVATTGFLLLADSANSADSGFSAPLRTVLPSLSIAVGAALVFATIWWVLARRRREELGWRHVAWSLGDVAWLSDDSGQRLHFLNEASERVYARKVADLLTDPRDWHEVVHPLHRERVEAWRGLVKSGGARDIEYAVVRPDGTERWLHDRAALITDVAGLPIGLGGIAQDITDARAAAEREREQRMRLEGILATATEAIVTIDRSQTVRIFNAAASRMFGVPTQDAVGLPLSSFLPASVADLHQARVAEFGRSGSTSRSMGQSARLGGVRSDGQAFPVEVSISRSGTGGQMMMTAVVRDVSELQAAEDARRAQAEAEAASTAKSEFLSRMSHEMRTPLNAILGFTQLLRSDKVDPLTTRQRERIGFLQSGAQHLLALINDVLDLARIDAAPSNAALVSVSLLECLDEAIAMCLELRERFSVNLVVDQASADIRVLGDVRRLRQVLINLLSNAFKYNRPGGEIRVRMRREAALALVEIEDTGVGMTPEQVRHLFEPFNRLGQEGGSVEGTGIGLLLTRELVQGMEGELDVRSVLGQGTCARVTLPLADESVQPTQPSALTAVAADDLAAAATGTVLYVEDNEVNATLIQEIVGLLPQVRYVHAANGQQGIDLARTLMPDLILLDMQLPDMSGIAVLKQLKADPSTANLLVVALSASSQPDEVADAKAAGAREYWTKPLECEPFLAAVSRLLRRRGERRSTG